MPWHTEKEKNEVRTSYGILAQLALPWATSKLYGNVADLDNVLRGPIPAGLEIPSEGLTIRHPDWDAMEAGNTLPKRTYDPQNFSEVLSPKIERLRSAIGAPEGVTVRTHVAPLLHSAGTYVHDPKLPDKWVQLPAKGRALDVLAHEFGHATIDSKDGFGALRKAFPGGRLAGLSNLVGWLGGAAIDPNDNTQAAGLLGAQALLHTPQLAEEGYASIRGLRGLRKMHEAGELSEAALKAAKGRLLKAFGTYGAAAAGGLLGTAGLLAVRRGMADDAIGV